MIAARVRGESAFVIHRLSPGTPATTVPEVVRQPVHDVMRSCVHDALRQDILEAWYRLFAFPLRASTKPPERLLPVFWWQRTVAVGQGHASPVEAFLHPGDVGQWTVGHEGFQAFTSHVEPGSSHELVYEALAGQAGICHRSYSEMIAPHRLTRRPRHTIRPKTLVRSRLASAMQSGYV